MSSLTQSNHLSQSKSTVHSLLLVAPDGTSAGILKVVRSDQRHNEITFYYFSPYEGDFGRSYRLDKFKAQGGETYYVHQDEAGHFSCECKGFLRWGFCKHETAIRQLLLKRQIS